MTHDTGGRTLVCHTERDSNRRWDWAWRWTGQFPEWWHRRWGGGGRSLQTSSCSRGRNSAILYHTDILSEGTGRIRPTHQAIQRRTVIADVLVSLCLCIQSTYEEYACICMCVGLQHVRYVGTTSAFIGLKQGIQRTSYWTFDVSCVLICKEHREPF